MLHVKITLETQLTSILSDLFLQTLLEALLSNSFRASVETWFLPLLTFFRRQRKQIKNIAEAIDADKIK